MDIVTHVVKYNAQTTGRDKLCRLFQYGSKFSWWYLERLKKDPQLVKRLKNLETNLSSTRKAIRIGKSLDMIQGALKAISLKDSVLCMTLTVSKLNQACYLLVDHLIWISKIGVLDTNTKKWARVSARFWLITILCNLVRNIYDLLRLTQAYLRLKGQKRGQDEAKAAAGWNSYREDGTSKDGVGAGLLFANHMPLVVDVVKNLSDLVLPLSSLGYLRTSAGFQGIMGIIGSLMGILVVWDPRLKQTPS